VPGFSSVFVTTPNSKRLLPDRLLKLIVLSTTRTGEKSSVVHTLSAEYGRRSFLLTLGPKMSSVLFLPLSVLDVELIPNTKSDLWRLKSVKAEYPLSGIRTDIYKNTISLFLSEVLFRVVREGALEDGLFEWCERSVLTLDSLKGEYSNFHLRFLMELCSALGFSIGRESVAPFAGNLYPVVCRLLDASFPEFMLFPLDGRTRNGIASVLIKYIGHHTETNLEIRSLKVLGEVFR